MLECQGSFSFSCYTCLLNNDCSLTYYWKSLQTVVIKLSILFNDNLCQGATRQNHMSCWSTLLCLTVCLVVLPPCRQHWVHLVYSVARVINVLKCAVLRIGPNEIVTFYLFYSSIKKWMTFIF